jgi:DNA-binding PadR family transcriptional regulator
MRAQAATKGSVERPVAMREMTSPVHWALLGLVIKRPGYGYDLLQRFEREYGDVLTLKSDSHIYAGINELVRRGFIEEVPGSRGIHSAGRQPRPSYHATAHGVHSYRERLMAQVREDRRQSRLFVRQLAAIEHEPDVALQIIECYEQACLEEASSTPVTPTGGPYAEKHSGLAARLVLEESRLAMQAKLPWIQYARRKFEALATDGVSP